MKLSARNINLVLIIFITLMLGVWFAFKYKNETFVMDPEIGFLYPQAKPIDDFKLIDFDGKSIDKSRFTGKWWVTYFGFTFCPDACPLALGDMKKIKSMLNEVARQKTDYVFVSVDPGRDTPERLKQYVEYFDPQFYAATGNEEELIKLATNMGVAFIVPENPVDENYIVDHSTILLLLNPRAELVAIFKAPHNPEEVAEEIMRIQDYFDDS